MKKLGIKNYLCLNRSCENEEFIINIGLSYILNGLDVIEELKQKYPKAKIMMDLKISENDYLNAKIAFDAEVDMVSILGNASLKTMKKVMHIAEANHKEVLVDMRNVKNVASCIEDLELLGIQYVLVNDGVIIGDYMIRCYDMDNVEQYLRMQMIAQELTI